MFNLNKWATTTNITLILLILLTGLITFIMWLKGLDSGWVQAIISVIAIFSAIIISNTQIEISKKERVNEQIEDIKKFMSILEICIGRYSALIKQIADIPEEYDTKKVAAISYHWKSIKITIDQIRQFNWLKYPDNESIVAVSTFIDTQISLMDNVEFLAKDSYRTYERSNAITKVIKVPKTVDDMVSIYFNEHKNQANYFADQTMELVFRNYNEAIISLRHGMANITH